MQYQTKEGDALDRICWQFYGTRADMATAVALVLEANPGIAKHGPLLPAGVVLSLPDLPTPVEERGISLWD
ncbi:tail protein X [Desulfovibrio subterraneus]|jgi:phage tail protein X|uniref:Tail protein X n=1 Tax=Desulfovibrio subterraneus TaxID=2718620 RepID=A0A7J0BL91_9BACT|nr:tail protein X [Desulfovibrio subterraneus]GFM34021.1 tail protein X [Desulfovibrio subterraneus]